jgi:multiple sugar transport system permease protein
MVSDPEVRPLPLQLGVFQAAYRPEWGSVAAFGVIFLLPVLVMFLIFQRNFIARVAKSGTNG